MNTSVTTIGNYAFTACASLEAVYFEGNAPIGEGVGGEWDIFSYSSPTVYYLPGTTGWGDSYFAFSWTKWTALGCR